MKDFTLTQEYIICLLGENGKLSALGNERVLFVGAALTELMDAGLVQLDEKSSKLYVGKGLGAQCSHLTSLYRYLNEKQRTIQQLVADYCISFTDKLYDELLQEVCADLITAGYLEAKAMGLFSSRKVYFPTHSISEDIKSKILSRNLVCGDKKNWMLAFLIDKANRLKKLFDKEEAKAIHKKIKSHRTENVAVQKMLSFLDEIVIVLSAIAAMSV